MKTPRPVKIVSGLVAIVGVTVFILGLAWSISTGFAGFWGGLPFWIIAIAVLAMMIYDYWDDCVKVKFNGAPK